MNNVTKLTFIYRKRIRIIGHSETKNEKRKTMKNLFKNQKYESEVNFMNYGITEKIPFRVFVVNT